MEVTASQIGHESVAQVTDLGTSSDGEAAFSGVDLDWDGGIDDVRSFSTALPCE